MVVMGPLMTIVIVLGTYAMNQMLGRLDKAGVDITAIRASILAIQLDSSRIDGELRRVFDRLDINARRIERLEERFGGSE
jgi:hypothetical protein